MLITCKKIHGTDVLVAHVIRSQRTKQCEAILALDSCHQWCLTGTPIQNRVEDLGALLRFLRVPDLENKRMFSTHVVKATRRSYQQGCEALRQTLKPICLRRRRALLNLAEPKTVWCSVEFCASEIDGYQGVMQRCRRDLDRYVSGLSALEARHTLLQSLLRLRIFCNQGTCTPAGDESKAQPFDPDETLALLEEKDEAVCTSCYCAVPLMNQFEDSASGAYGSCSHLVCAACYKEAVQPGKNEQWTYLCPVCDMQVAPIQDTSGSLGKLRKRRLGVSSKLNKLIENLRDEKGREKR